MGTRREPRRWGRVVLVLALVSGLVAVLPSAGAAPGEVHLTAAGDFGARAATSTVLAKIAELQPDAHLALGDLAYRDVASEAAWCEFVKTQLGEGFPMELIAGNHESLDVADGAINNFSACLPNQLPGVVGTYGREYYVDLPRGAPIVRVIQTSPHLTFENGKWTYAEGDSHHAWLSAAIDGGRARGAQWIVVTGHVPCLSVGVYTCPIPPDYYRLLMSKRVDLVLHGHEHAYMRTHQLRSDTAGCATVAISSFNPACVADSDGSFVAGQGTVFATVGTGGTPLRDIAATDPEAGYFAAAGGLNASPTHGLLDLRFTDTQLTAHFLPTSGAGFTDAFTLTRGGANLPPVASFTTAVQGRAVTVDGSASSDPDGTIAGHTWTFGDGSSATGATPPAHTYASAGTYTVTLTVADALGATGTRSQQVTVADPVQVLASDGFTRTQATGWGSAPAGGSWTVSTASAFAVNGSAGLITSSAGSGRSAYLRAVSSTAADTSFTVTADRLSTGSGLYVAAAGRAIAGAGDYRATVRLRADGRVALRLALTNATGVETYLAPETLISGLTYTAGTPLTVRVQVTGVNPTQLRAKVWRTGSAEPTGWATTATNSQASHQVSGGIGIVTYLSSTATNAPIVLAVDDLVTGAM